MATLVLAVATRLGLHSGLEPKVLVLISAVCFASAATVLLVSIRAITQRLSRRAWALWLSSASPLLLSEDIVQALESGFTRLNASIRTTRSINSIIETS